MTEQPAAGPSHWSRYEIRLGGRLEPRWAAWLDGMTLARTDDGSTVLTGPAALHGLLRKVRDLGLPLLAVAQIGSIQQHTPSSPPCQPRKEAP
jgi:hypothetical protein